MCQAPLDFRPLHPRNHPTISSTPPPLPSRTETQATLFCASGKINKSPVSLSELPEHSGDTVGSRARLSVSEKSRAELRSVLHSQAPGSIPLHLRPLSPLRGFVLAVASAAKGPAPSSQLRVPPSVSAQRKPNLWKPGEPVSAGWDTAGVRRSDNRPPPPFSTLHPLGLGAASSKTQPGWVRKETPGGPLSVELEASAQASGSFG